MVPFDHQNKKEIPKIITITAIDVDWSFNKSEKNAKSAITLEFSETATSPEKPIKKTKQGVPIVTSTNSTFSFNPKLATKTFYNLLYMQKKYKEAYAVLKYFIGWFKLKSKLNLHNCIVEFFGIKGL